MSKGERTVYLQALLLSGLVTRTTAAVATRIKSLFAWWVPMEFRMARVLGRERCLAKGARLRVPLRFCPLRWGRTTALDARSDFPRRFPPEPLGRLAA